jgi:hypothetical protein
MSTSPLFTNILTSIQQVQTPLNSLFFSEFNLNLVHQAIRQQVKKNTGMAIDKQNTTDLLAIMRSVFINNASDPYSAVCEQVRQMNTVVIKTAVQQIYTGMSQYMDYNIDIATPFTTLPNPINPNMYGNKIGTDYNIGI